MQDSFEVHALQDPASVAEQEGAHIFSISLKVCPQLHFTFSVQNLKLCIQESLYTLMY